MAALQRLPSQHFLDSMTIPLVPAALCDPGDSGDRISELHHKRGGLKRFSLRYAALVAQGMPE